MMYVHLPGAYLKKTNESISQQLHSCSFLVEFSFVIDAIVDKKNW